MTKRIFNIFPVMLFLCLPVLLNSAQEAESPLLKSWEQYLELKKTSEFGLKWVSLGPTVNSARVEAIQCDPTHPGTWYTAFGSGNLWKTTDHGLTWRPIFENQAALGIGDIALAPSNPEIIWLGTGESLKKARNFTMPGVGVFRSENGGLTWKNMGLPDSYHIGEIAIHPQDPDIVFVAVQGHFWSANPNRGVYRTVDGGQTWEHVLYVSERVGANDVVIAPSNPDVIYVSMWENNPGTVGPESGVYKSEDGGKTFVRMSGGLPDGSQTGRIGVAVSWSDPNKAYALIDNFNLEVNKTGEVYRTLDGGETWTRTHEEPLQIFSQIGWYFADIYVNPQNDEEIYCLGVSMAHSSDGGQTFDFVRGDIYHLFPSPAEFLHVDNCELWINPLNPQHLALGNDGGLFVSYNRGDSWLHYNNLPAGEFYDISVDNQDPYFVYGGTQDDSSVYGPSREWQPQFPDGWKYIWIDSWSGGDGCVTVPDPEDPNIVYTSSQNGGIFRKDLKADRSQGIRPRLPKEHEGELAYEFVAPYILSPHNRLTLYHAGNYVFKSLNRGNNWRLISPNLAGSADPNKQSNAAGAIAESPIKPGLLYVGTDKGAFWVTENDGVEWIEYSQGLPNRYIRSICPSRFTESRVYVAVTGINYDDLNGYLFVSEDNGKVWRSIMSNLPNETTYVILEDPTNENILYAGLYRGVYVSVDRGMSWALLGPDMAATAIADLVIQEREMDLLAATHGRGIYRTNLRPIQQAFEKGIPQENLLFETPVARLPWINDTHRDPKKSTMEKVPITFYLLEEKEVTIAVKGKNKKTIWSEKMIAYKGFNQIRWDLVTDRPVRNEAYFWRYLVFARAGEYDLSITGEGLSLNGKLRIVGRQNPPF